MNSVVPGHIGFWHFWQVCPHYNFQKMVLISFEHLKKISHFPKLQGCGSKNKPAVPFLNLNLNSPYISQFCIYNLLLLDLNSLPGLDILLLQLSSQTNNFCIILEKNDFICQLRPSIITLINTGPKIIKLNRFLSKYG